MKKGPTLVLQIVIVLIGIGALAFMLLEPHFEGRNVDSTVYEIYFKDPFLAYAYIASIPFFVALYQAIKLLGYIRQNKVFSPNSVKALQTIKYCGEILVGFGVAFEVWLFVFQRNSSDDIAGGVFMGLLLIFGSGTVAIVAKMFGRVLQNAVDIKSENNLTV